MWLCWQCDDELSSNSCSSCFHKLDLYVSCHMEDKGVEVWWSQWPILWTPIPNTGGRWFRNSCVDWYMEAFWHGGSTFVPVWSEAHLQTDSAAYVSKTTHKLHLSAINPVNWLSVISHCSLVENWNWKFASTELCGLASNHKYASLVLFVPSWEKWA
jgi:hypothetical protein